MQKTHELIFILISATINRREYNKLSTVENEDDEDDLIDPHPLTPDEILMDYDVQDSEDEESDRSNLWGEKKVIRLQARE